MKLFVALFALISVLAIMLQETTAARPWYPRDSRCNTPFQGQIRRKRSPRQHTTNENTFYKYNEHNNKCEPFHNVVLPEYWGFKTWSECEAACRDIYHP